MAYHYCRVNSFFCNIHDVQRQQSSKRSRGREVSSLPRMTNRHQGEKRKEKKREYLTKHKTPKYQSPTVPPSSVTHAMGGICPSDTLMSVATYVSLIVQIHYIVLWNRLLLRWQLQILQSDFLELRNTLHNRNAIIPSTESYSALVSSLRMYWAGIFIFEFWKYFCILF